MQCVYAALLLHAAGQKIDEESIKKVLTAAGAKIDEARIKALVSSLEGVNIDEAIKEATTFTQAPQAAAPQPEKKEEEKKEEKKKEEEKKSEEEAAAGLGALFG